MLRNWKREFLEHAGEVFENPGKASAQEEVQRLKKETGQMLKPAGQLTPLLQDCVRRCGLLGIRRSVVCCERKAPDEESARLKEEPRTDCRDAACLGA